MSIDLGIAGHPRDRLLRHGAHQLRLLTTVGGVPGLARCHPEALCRLPGLGRMTAARLVAALALPVRNVIATVLRHDGHAFAIAHNHPSGDPTPSVQDRNATLRCRTAAAVGLRFLAHVVLGEHDSWRNA